MLRLFERLLYIANSSKYSEKDEYFYPLKNRLLLRHAVYDGYDEQVINKDCWNCNGTGIDKWDTDCDKCNSSGIYEVKKYYLKRYILNNRLYHSPQFMKPDGECKETIEGLIQHEPIASLTGKRACKWLMLRYDFLRLLKLELFNLTEIITSPMPKRFILANNIAEKLFVSGASLFSGHAPYYWTEETVKVVKLHKDANLSHLTWVLRAWQRARFTKKLKVYFNPLLIPIFILGSVFTGWMPCKISHNHILLSVTNDDDYMDSYQYYSFYHFKWMCRAYRKD